MQDRPRASGLTARLHLGLDNALLALFRQLGPTPDEAAMRYRARLLEQAVAVHERRGWASSPADYLQTPPPLDELTSRPSRVRGVDVTMLTWTSGHQPDPEEPGADAWMSRRRNRTARAWLVEGDPEAPWLVCVHGHGGGIPAMDLTAFHAPRLVERHGINLAMPVLPRHGRRRDSPIDPGGFLAGDIIETVHGTAQSVWDVRRLLRWLRRHRGASRVGMYGVSLGSWVTAIVAGLEELDLVVAGIPLIDVADLFRRHAPAEQRDMAIELGALGPLAEQVTSVVSPLLLTPRAAEAARRVYAGDLDRLTSTGQAERLVAHWDEPEHLWFDGGHVSFVWNRAVARFVDEAIASQLLGEPAVPAG